MKYILGVNAFHADTSAVLLENGHVIAGIEEEKFTRLKHWSGFPKQSINGVYNMQILTFQISAISVLIPTLNLNTLEKSNTYYQESQISNFI